MEVVKLARTVYGTITDKNGNPARNLRVRAMDSDTWPNPDDRMGDAMTDSNGYYEIHYEGKHWDAFPHRWTRWRPDIYIKVAAPVNGRCDNGKWKPDRNWKYLGRSSVTSNHPHRNNLRKNLQLNNFPLDPVEVHTFQRGVDMWSEIDFFFHGKAFGCAPNGDKVEWSYWTAGGPPKIATRCWNPPKNKCTPEDIEKIRDLGFAPYPAEAVRNALIHLVESDDIDEDAENAFMGVLKEIQEYMTKNNIAKAKELMESFKQNVNKETKKNSITQRASMLLLVCADKFLEAHV